MDIGFICRESAARANQTYYEKADIYLQYSIQEGFCNAVLEAQAMGLLCIVSDAEGLPENILHGQTGWVVPKGNWLC
ncbi:MAG: glycosyltransferase family 4 protein [Saprospiraceae bacterium]|nr:glycosyltransferase family 4 protein [Saprospiraceae bacterium]